MIRTVVFGKSRLACQIAEYFLNSPEHELVAVVPSIQSSPTFVSVADFARTSGVPILESTELESVGIIDLGFSCFYDKIFRSGEIVRFKRLVNLHNSPLPRYRGVRPINWALANGENTHGVTIHDIDAGVDTGPILSQCTFAIFSHEEVVDVYQRAQRFGWQLFLETAPNLMTLESVSQDEERATTYTTGDAENLGEWSGFVRPGSCREVKFPL